MMDLLLNISIGLILIFSFTNGMKDGCNVMATTIASRSISRKNAMLIVMVSEFAGPFLFGIPVAVTVAKGIINVDLLPSGIKGLEFVFSGITGAIVWNFVTWLLKMPTSSSFALVGGLVGPAIYSFGRYGIPWKIFLTKGIAALLLSPLLGVAAGFFTYKIFSFLFQNASMKANFYIKKVQMVSLVFLGLNHGNNDSQKAMGIIALLLFLAGKTDEIQIFPWVILVSISALTMGISMGGTKIIKTIGYDIFHLKPLHSLSSHLSSILLLLFSNIFGAPVSTTQLISSSVIGVGSAFRRKSVRWSLFITIIWSWILTIPLAAIISMAIFIVLGKII